MSLLLEALKKAELAKQGKKPAADDTPARGLQLEPTPASATQPRAQPVITRGELPDISQPLEILSEDLPSASARREAAEVAAEPAAEEPSAPPPPPDRAPRAAEPEPEPELEVASITSASRAPSASPIPGGSAERDAARQLFEAKEVEYNPKRNFYITIGLLVAAGTGYGGYVWWELQPKNNYSAAALQNAAKAVAAAPAAPAPPPQPVPAVAEDREAPVTLPPVAAKTAAAGGAVVEPQPAEPKPGPVFARNSGPAAAVRPTDRPAGPSPSQGQRPARGEQSPITITPPALAVDPLVERGFASYQRGDLVGAREAYQQALAREPLNRDALLGLAAIDVRARSFDSAEARYIRLLELDPRDVHAVGGLLSLRGHVDPAQSESRLKTLIAGNPDASGLHFPLGNQYAQQSRWAEAQAAYFKAYAGDSENADFAFNLAISLDQLRQKTLALQYYRRAMSLAADRPVSFDVNQVLARIQELLRP